MNPPSTRTVPPLSLRQSIAPRVLDNSLPMTSLVSNERFSVRVAPPNSAPCTNPSNTLTTFLWREPAASAWLAGSFDDWRKHQMLFVPGVNYHILVTELPPGEYAYRFVVDGRWRVADGDPNLKEDQFGHLSHFITITSDARATLKSKRFSTAAVANTDIARSEAVLDHGQSDTESERSFSDVDDAPDPPQTEPPAPRCRGSAYIGDYDDDAYAGLDLQADIFEAMKDVAEVNPNSQSYDRSPSRSHSTFQEPVPKRRLRNRPGGRMLRKVWAMLFGDPPADENMPPGPDESDHPVAPTHNQRVHGLVSNENALKKGLKVWFPNERNYPSKSPNGRKMEPSETKDVIDAGDRALRLHQVEENANNRQMLGKNLFAQGKYDAALALFSLSVKLREDNGLKYARATAIAHTDVASAFIQLEDLKNAEKHLKMALAIFDKATFSGGKAQLGDVHCFLGVIGDMRGDYAYAEACYMKALELYEKCRATDNNPNYSTARENLDANRRRQQALGTQSVSSPPTEQRVDNRNERKGASRHITSPHSPNTSSDSRRKLPRGNKSPGARHGPPSTSRGESPKSSVGTSKFNKASQRPSRPLDAPRPSAFVQHSPATSSGGVSAISTDVGLQETESSSHSEFSRASNRPTTWKGLAETARASMPKNPPVEDYDPQNPSVKPSVGSYEEMCQMWHNDARSLLGEGKYKEAFDMYSLAVYTRKRNGPWITRENTQTLVECARAAFAIRDFAQTVTMLRDAIGILEKMPNVDDQITLGGVWGNLGSVLDRIGGHDCEALTAHSTGMVVYGKAGIGSEDPKWTKAWKGLCTHLNKTGRMNQMDEMWLSIDQQIRGIIPMTKVASVQLHR